MTARDRRALIAGLTLVAGILVAFRGAPAGWRRYAALRTHALERHATLARAQETIAARSALRDSLSGLAIRLVGLAPKVVAVGSPADGAAELSRIVNSISSRANLHVTRLEPLLDSSAAGLSETAVRLEVEGDLQSITAFLGDVEQGDPVLSVPEWTIQAGERSASEVERLRAELTVVGVYVRRENP